MIRLLISHSIYNAQIGRHRCRIRIVVTARYMQSQPLGSRPDKQQEPMESGLRPTSIQADIAFRTLWRSAPWTAVRFKSKPKS